MLGIGSNKFGRIGTYPLSKGVPIPPSGYMFITETINGFVVYLTETIGGAHYYWLEAV
jgi:hypothetical protein